MDVEKIRKLISENGPRHWYMRYEAVPGSGVFTPGSADKGREHYEKVFSTLEWDTTSFSGMRVLDIGAYNGALSFFMEEKGAEVVALDIQSPELNGFNLIKGLRNSPIIHRQASVYDLNREEFGQFDVVTYFGVFYHLKHPLLAFERIGSVLKQGGVLMGGGTTCDLWFHNADDSCEYGVNLSGLKREEFADKQLLSVDCVNDLPICGFVEKQYYKDVTNWFVPNTACVVAWLGRCGFELKVVRSHGARRSQAWNVKDLGQSSAIFKAVNLADPELEYPDSSYTRDYRQGYFMPGDVYQYRIPTEHEVIDARTRIHELESLLRQHGIEFE